jgi:hypothetical protein
VQFGTAYARGVCPRAAKSASESTIAGARALHGERFSHDRASATQNLEVRHAASAWRDIVTSGGGRERAECGGGSLREKWTHGPRLAENGLHDGDGRYYSEEAKSGGGVAQREKGGRELRVWSGGRWTEFNSYAERLMLVRRQPASNGRIMIGHRS